MKVVYRPVSKSRQDELDLYYKIYTEQPTLTPGKSYDVICDYPTRYFLENDIGNQTSYKKKYFITLDEYRSLQIDKLI